MSTDPAKFVATILLDPRVRPFPLIHEDFSNAPSLGTTRAHEPPRCTCSSCPADCRVRTKADAVDLQVADLEKSPRDGDRVAVKLKDSVCRETVPADDALREYKRHVLEGGERASRGLS
jgi:hypothetical protein